MAAIVDENSSLLSPPASLPSPSPSVDRRPSSLRRVLYLSHFFAQWAERMWEFSVVLFLSSIAPSSLFLVSSYGLFQCLAIILSGSAAGNYIDRTERMKAFRLILMSQNGFVLACSLCCYVLLGTNTASSAPEWHPPLWAKKMLFHIPMDYFSLSMIVLIHLFGALGAVFSRASTVAIEKDWVVVLSRGSSNWLKETNVMMRQIDLFSKVMAPVMAGVVMKFGSIEDTALFVGILNILAIIVEFFCTAKIYEATPELSEPRKDPVVERTNSRADDDLNRPSGWIHSLRAFFSQRVWGAGVALSLLYLNVLSFGNIMIAYLQFRNMGPTLIGVTRGVGETFGLLGTLIFKVSE